MTLNEMRAERDRLSGLIAKEEQRIEREQFAATIKALDIRREDVESPGNPGMPWFSLSVRFHEWLVKNSKKPFCEWNGLVYLTAEFPSLARPLCRLDMLR